MEGRKARDGLEENLDFFYDHPRNTGNCVMDKS